MKKYYESPAIEVLSLKLTSDILKLSYETDIPITVNSTPSGVASEWGDEWLDD